jgi:hypothetical protein
MKEVQSTQRATRERNITNVKARNTIPFHWGLKIPSNANAFAELQQIATQQEEAISPSSQAQLPEDYCLSPPTTNEHYLACYTLPPTACQIVSWLKKTPPPMANSPLVLAQLPGDSPPSLASTNKQYLSCYTVQQRDPEVFDHCHKGFLINQ